MLEYIWKKFKRDNDVAQELESSPYMNTEGLEQKINVPEPTRDDKRWARKIKDATSGDIARALLTAIELGQNWRVWYLINRPLKSTTNFFTKKIMSFGFDGNTRLKDGLDKAAEHDNVTAAYLLLKFAEKNQTAYYGPGDAQREEMDHFTREGVLNAAQKPGSDVFRLIAKTFFLLTNERAKSVMHLLDDTEVMKQAALRAGAAGHDAHLDTIIDNNLLTPRQLVETYMESFSGATTAAERKPFMNWLLKRGIVDQVFADEASSVEVRVTAQKEAFKNAVARGWRESAREMQREDGTSAPADASQAEITIPSGAEGRPLTFVFNYNARLANIIGDQPVRSFTFAEGSHDVLVAEGKAFLDNRTVATPALQWKKGEPFRLRLKPPAP